jgi:hypothetical protein
MQGVSHWSHVQSRWKHFWAISGYLGSTLEHLKTSWDLFGPFGGVVAPSRGILAHLLAILGPSWNHLGPSWAIWEPYWHHLGPSWDILGVLGSSSALRFSHVYEIQCLQAKINFVLPKYHACHQQNVAGACPGWFGPMIATVSVPIWVNFGAHNLYFFLFFLVEIVFWTSFVKLVGPLLEQFCVPFWDQMGSRRRQDVRKKGIESLNDPENCIYNYLSSRSQ